MASRKGTATSGVIHRHSMNVPFRLAIIAPLFGAAGVLHAEVDYLKSVKPLLQERCYTCHGALKQKAELRLDTAAAILKGGESGAALKRRSADESLIVQRVTATDLVERMPPLHEGEPFTAAQVAILREWIASGAPAPADEKPETDPREHWAFRPRTKPPVPKVANAAWIQNPIDAFVAAQHEKYGLTPQPEAPREVLMRRLWLDLVGVPPSPGEIEAFTREVITDQQTAIGNFADKLLTDPRHGERWARHWMDIWRYSDWWGLGDQLRNSQKHIWHWRDWIVESLNSNVPYDEMLRQMLAADELYPTDPQRLRATGFLARNYFLFNRNQWMEETVEHVSKSLLGLTINCAKCHDHKYDPIAQADFYRMRAFFEPYHVRLDAVPGETDFEKDAIPRVFDGLPSEPTYRFVRGDESRPDKNVPLAPGVPAFLQFASLNVRTVELPIEAREPERQPWVLESHIAAARKKIAGAEETLAHAKKLLTETAERTAKTQTKPARPPAISERFDTLDSKRWKLFGGEWRHERGRLEQKRDGQTSAALRLVENAPRDFDVTMRITIHGGSVYRSVGMAFDATTSNPSQPGGASDSETTVYASAHAPEPKVQAAFGRGGQYQYPAEGKAARPIMIGREYNLRVQVRDTLINASLDGEPAVAWRTPLARRDGALQFTTFDALATFHEITIAPLDAAVNLREPGSSAPATPAGAKAALSIAELAFDVAKAELESITTQHAALSSEDPAIREAAIRAAQRTAVAKAKLGVADVEQKLLNAAADKKPAVEKEIAAAREVLAKAEKAAVEPLKPDATFPRVAGAKWTPTRFKNSTADDPLVTFPKTSTGRRSALAAWVTDARNPLTARVAVNHIWARHFGTPLVATVFDFGRKGAMPTHPELLDWLACELVESGWNMRHIHKLIVTSATYRMSSSLAGGEAGFARDPDNIHLWHRDSQRLEAEVVRDSLLALSGELDVARGGPSIPPGEQDNSKRRSLYFFHSNNDRNLFLTTFDAAAVKECYRRDRSIVPQQALAMSNSALVHTAAEKIAARIAKAAPAEPDFIRSAWTQLLAITPDEAETAASSRALAAWRALPSATDIAARAQLIRALLNHNDFVTLR